MTNPYASAEDFKFWRRAVSSVPYFQLDPVVNPKFRIAKTERIATAGSCFAQHIARWLAAQGYCYFVAENDASLTPEEQRRKQYGVFSARFGNIYTVSQLRQLFDEAFGIRTPAQKPWQRPDGRFIDPLRPNVEPDGWASPREVIAARRDHLIAVREMFRDCAVFVFTLGLTEAWREISSGETYPLAPGVVGGVFDPAIFEFHNFTIDTVVSDLCGFLASLKDVNPSVKTILTVSPVPLIATFENRHVLTATVYSKSVLRVAADTAARRFDWVDYFPSYEIITAGSPCGRYFAPDLREVTPLGVSHVMRCFAANYLEGAPPPRRISGRSAAKVFAPEAETEGEDVICDEEAIDQMLRP